MMGLAKEQKITVALVRLQKDKQIQMRGGTMYVSGSLCMLRLNDRISFIYFCKTLCRAGNLAFRYQAVRQDSMDVNKLREHPCVMHIEGLGRRIQGLTKTGFPVPWLNRL